MWEFYICLCILLLLMAIIVIITITFIVNIILIIFIITRIFMKSSLLFLWGKLTVWFCFFQFLHVLTWAIWSPISVDALPLDIIIWHHLWWHEGKGHRLDCWCHLSNIMPDSISGDNWEVGKSLRFLFSFVKGSWHYVCQ